MGLHQMFWIKREMVVKGRERERESSQEKGYTLPSMPCGKLTCNIIPVSLCFERERGICWCTSKSSCKSNERPWPRTSSLCIGISWGTAASKPSLLISTWIGCIRRHTLLSRMDDNGRQGRHFRHHHHQLLFPFPSLTWRRRLMVTFPPFQECCFVLSFFFTATTVVKRCWSCSFLSCYFVRWRLPVFAFGFVRILSPLLNRKGHSTNDNPGSSLLLCKKPAFESFFSRLPVRH